MTDLTVIILTKNEEVNLIKCVSSLQDLAKRIVVIDSYSTDRTEEICRELKIDFYQHEFTDHASQFNWALDNVDINTQWSMRMDADEELTVDLYSEIKTKLHQIKEPVNGIILKRRVYFLGKWIKHGDVYPQCLLRIFRTGTAICEQKLMDEHIVLLSGTSITFDKDLIDNNTKDLEWWTQKHNWYSGKEMEEYLRGIKRIEEEEVHNIKPTLFKGQAERKRWIKDTIYYKIPLFTRPALYFCYRYFIKLGFLDGKQGVIFHFLQGFWYRFLVDAKIYEYRRKTSSVELALKQSGSERVNETKNKTRSI
ncbi:hypothetical protein TCA2_3599 [Paenibacillus sp. TCA20]|uniref:glycosyltransferase family 2 protein n=1 Tax=Paenibacillus sp. TCA20 TaxID=1499968 RepID=UPI0004D7046D|nr:glycosyltransferase family 2 protein [Paenibacillus sp. TCA20]GAK41108.1 hypothetical protein TCA2_3599 [Paenibacillus sp. TCA20]